MPPYGYGEYVPLDKNPGPKKFLPRPAKPLPLGIFITSFLPQYYLFSRFVRFAQLLLCEPRGEKEETLKDRFLPP